MPDRPKYPPKLPTRDLGDHPRRCVGHNTTTGERCQNYAIRGGSVCPKHGGLARQVREAAKLRIQLAADPAAAKLVSLMKDRRVPPQVQLAAARDLLDRAGLNTVQQIEVLVAPWQNLMGNGAVDFDLGPIEVDEIPEIDDVTPSQEPRDRFPGEKKPRAAIGGRRKPDPSPPGYSRPAHPMRQGRSPR